MDDAAFGEATLLDQPLHDKIIGMGIDPDILAELTAIAHSTLKQAVGLPVAGNSVDRNVRRVVQPAAIFDVLIGWLRPLKQGKYSVYPQLRLTSGK